jgi:hypothetical protein
LFLFGVLLPGDAPQAAPERLQTRLQRVIWLRVGLKWFFWPKRQQLWRQPAVLYPAWLPVDAMKSDFNTRRRVEIDKASLTLMNNSQVQTRRFTVDLNQRFRPVQ